MVVVEEGISYIMYKARDIFREGNVGGMCLWGMSGSRRKKC